MKNFAGEKASEQFENANNFISIKIIQDAVNGTGGFLKANLKADF